MTNLLNICIFMTNSHKKNNVKGLVWYFLCVCISTQSMGHKSIDRCKPYTAQNCEQSEYFDLGRETRTFIDSGQ